MRRAVFWAFGVAVLSVISTLAACAQEEVVHPGETYDSLQAGQDAYGDAEAQRRAMIGRQLMLEDQIQAQNTWSDPRSKYRPVQPESYGPIRPQVYLGPTLADVYAYPQSAIVYYNATPATPTPVASAAIRSFCGAGARFSAVAPCAGRHLGHSLLWLCAAADRPCEDLDGPAELHLQAGLRLARDGVGGGRRLLHGCSAGGSVRQDLGRIRRHRHPVPPKLLHHLRSRRVLVPARQESDPSSKMRFQQDRGAAARARKSERVGIQHPIVGAQWK